MPSRNPVLSSLVGKTHTASARTGVMSVAGVVDKAVILFFIMLIGASWTWKQFLNETAGIPGLMTLGLFGGFIAAMVALFKPTWAPWAAPVYAFMEGLFLGGLSAFFNYTWPGLPIQAVGLTFGVLLTMLIIYRTGVIRVTDKLRRGVTAAIGGVFFFFLFSWILSWFGMRLNFLYDASPLGIGISLVIIGIAAFSLLLDFDSIEQAARQHLPAYMNWVAALGLLVTLVWLYLEILRLLARLREE